MLADENTTPGTLPPGFSYIADEPTFDASRHLALEAPKDTMTLEDFGYGPSESAQFTSPVAAASPTRLLSDEGITAAQTVLELLQPRTSRHGDTTDFAGRKSIYFGEYQSRFLRDLARCPEMIGFLSDIFQTPVASHTMGHLGCQINLGNETPGGPIADWHHDIVGFTVVLSLHDPSQMQGGHFVYFKGPRDEGQRLLDSGRPLPEDRLVAADQVPMGHATIMQGSAILHAAQPMQNAGYRCNIVNSYVSRDVRAPDPNRGFLVRDFYPGMPTNPIYSEMARHAAWLGKAKLGTVLESMAWTEDRTRIIAELSAAIEDVTHCIRQLEVGDVSLEQYRKERERADERQMATPVFDPGQE